MARKIGPYEVVKRLAVGGAAEIYLATNPASADPTYAYALKVLLPHLEQEPDQRKMMVDEANLTKNLIHPNIVKVHDLGDDDGTIYMVMEHVDGLNLSQWLARLRNEHERVPIEAAALIARDTCAALHFAHTRGAHDGTPLQLVHRDVSPQNILIGFNGEVKVIDFGVAKAVLGGRLETKTGIIKGKLAYMAPEYALGSQQDHRSDIFAVGLCLYEMLTGRAAYDLEEPYEVVEAVKNARIRRPTEARPEIPLQLETILAKALELSPTDRWDTAGMMQDALTRFLADFAPSFDTSGLAVLLSRSAPSGAAAPRVIGETRQGGPLPVDDDPDATDRNPLVKPPLGLSQLRSLADEESDVYESDGDFSALETMAIETEDHSTLHGGPAIQEAPAPADAKPGTPALQVRSNLPEGLALSIADIPSSNPDLDDLDRQAPTATNINLDSIRGDMVERIARPNRPQILTQSGFQRLARRPVERPTEPAALLPHGVVPAVETDQLATTGPMPRSGGRMPRRIQTLENVVLEALPLDDGIVSNVTGERPRPSMNPVDPHLAAESSVASGASVRGGASPQEVMPTEHDLAQTTQPQQYQQPAPQQYQQPAPQQYQQPAPQQYQQPAPQQTNPAAHNNHQQAQQVHQAAEQPPQVTPHQHTPLQPTAPDGNLAGSANALMSKVSASYDSLSPSESGRRRNDLLMVVALGIIFLIVVVYVLIFAG